MAAAQMIGVNFGDPSMYSGASFIPDGDYCMTFDAVLHTAVDKNTGVARGKARLGVMVNFYPLSNLTEEGKLQQFYSMGSKAHESFAPNPETGKGFVPVPGAKGGSFNDKTNWMMFLNSLWQSGMPVEVLSNDFSTIDGVWGHVTNVDEPAERASFKSNTAEIQQEERKPGKVAVVSLILEGGAPWEGGGGFEAPAAAPPVQAPPVRPGPKPVTAAPAAVAPKPGPRPVAAGPRPVAAAPAPPPSNALAEQDLRSHAITGISDVLTKKPNGLPRLLLRNETVKYFDTNGASTTGAAVIAAYFEPSGADALQSLLGEMGYFVDGAQVKLLPS
jgi:hypothetical protein